MFFRKNLIYLPALIIEMSASSAILGVTYRASRLGASPMVIGIMASANILVYLLCCQVFGRLSDRISRKKLILSACLAHSVFYICLSFCNSLKILAVFFPINGIIISAFWPALEAWIGEQASSGPLIKRIRLFNLSWTTGSMIGYFTGGYISEIYGSAPFYFAGFFGGIAATAVNFIPEPGKYYELSFRDRGNSNEITENKSVENSRMILRFLYLSWAANFANGLTVGIMRYIFQKLIYQMGMSPSIFGLLTACQVGTQALMFFILGSTDRWHYRFRYLICSQLLACVGFVAIWLSDYIYLWILGLVAMGINSGMTYFSSIYYSLNGHSDLGNKTGLHETITSSGAFLGPIIGGSLASYIGLKFPYLFCVVTLVIGIFVQIFMFRKTGFAEMGVQKDR